MCAFSSEVHVEEFFPGRFKVPQPPCYRNWPLALPILPLHYTLCIFVSSLHYLAQLDTSGVGPLLARMQLRRDDSTV
ncbi:hypothetical protein M011DRAFT_472005 [Sporormia fimetaria CBS 119925]|uniref:Uncharacterized protein n=1 Tax=Sporormia fimetaria CBS 119925 TaxID=1340428 RepID=A0A6A6V048_9PLEO|nr:hypothetical protein M011DRAFT_472005 [Sporormia fimetaria CBS 119925]